MGVVCGGQELEIKDTGEGTNVDDLPIDRNLVSRLCETCADIEYPWPIQSSQPCNKTRDREGGTFPDQALGTPAQILERANRCDFCTLITKHLARYTGLDPTGQCWLTGESNLFLSCDQPDFTRDGLHTHVKKTSIQFRPSKTMYWLPLPWELDDHDSQGIPIILDFQTDARAPQSKHDDPSAAFWGRRVMSHIDMGLVRRWLSLCENAHVGRCPHSSNVPDWAIDTLPSFVIDVRNWCVTRPLLHCRYVALSYVWGSGIMLKHLCENSSTLQKHGSLRSMALPRTILHALSVVEELQERYLWVDALCIIQDSASMQQSQIARMDQIYANALLTIIATSGNDANAELPGCRLYQREEIQDIVSLPKFNIRTLICKLEESRSPFKTATWASRAWTMQEIICSSRCLIFTDHQVYWRCQSAVWLEEIALESAASTDLEILPLAVRDRFPSKKLNYHKYFQFFADLLGNYMRRQLTFQSDTLNAFSGLCNRISAIQDDRFFWGLPESQFSRSLAWSLHSKACRNHAGMAVIAANGPVLFPSWSWAAWNSIDSKPWINFERSDSWHLVNGPEYHEGPSGHEFQPVIDFWIRDVSGRILPIKESATYPLSKTDASNATHRLPWQGLERVLPHSLSDATNSGLQRPGLLFFWTSVLTLNLADEKDAELAPVVEFDETRRTWQQGDHSTDEQGTFSVDYVVLCRTAETRSEFMKKNLLILMVQWQDGIAYRLGSGIQREESWLAYSNRRWKLVVLG